MKERSSPCLKFHSDKVWKIGAITVQGASSVQGCEFVKKQSHTKSTTAGEAEVQPRWGGLSHDGEGVGRG